MPVDKNPIETVRNGPVYRITMQRPAKKNALNIPMYNGLVAGFETAESDPDIRVILLTATGDTFTSGNDLNDFMRMRDQASRLPGTAFLSVLTRVRKPIVAAVNGPAIGIGSTMLLHCDLVYASESARFQMPFVNLGLCPEAGSSYLLPKRIGHQRASALLLLGESFSAREAQSMGIVNQVCPAEKLADVAMQAARKLAAQPLDAVMLTKDLLKADDRRGLDAAIKEELAHFTERLASKDFEAAYTAFKTRLSSRKTE